MRGSLEKVQAAAMISAVASRDRLVCRPLVAMMRNHAMPRGCRPAEPYDHNLDPTCTPTQMHAYRPCDNYPPTFFRSDILSDPV